ncbi:2Fe-2S iron-sulfur cluster-binding protein [Buchnera aphidicola (Takecallis taiwana)]|uniref:2Fe-2S iron-sulfur cluster-binding protein n=1 Tax=Buchnera aphidicola TaxID=9 RepID=UPI0031B87CD5
MNLKNFNYKKKNYIIQVNNRKLYIKPEEKKLSLLKILLIHRINIFYQCNSGYCGSCNIKLIYGTIYQFQTSIACIQPGYILACVCQIQSNIKIQI